MTEPLASPPLPRILFVDDEQRVLEGLSASLRRLRRTWDMHFVCGGAAALAVLESGRFDAIVTDMRMPGTDGEAVLLAARTRYPGTVRIILSGQTDAAVVRRTIRAAHQFLSKPCDADELRECLQRLLGVTAPMGQRMRDLVCAVGHIPISPSSVARLRELFEKPTLDTTEIVACIEQDCALAAKLLHVASAGFFAARQEVTSVQRAVAVLGTETILGIALSMEVCDENEHARRFLKHSLATGPLRVRAVDGEEPSLGRARHGLGKLVLLTRFGDDYADLLKRVDAAPSLRLEELELHRFGVSHEAVGTNLAGLWGISPALAAAM